MEFDVWEPIYEAILDDLGFSRAADERARDELAGLLAARDRLTRGVLEGRSVVDGTVLIAGGAASLSGELDRVRNADTVLAASTAADVLLEAGIGVDCMVTDLDKNPETTQELTKRGVPVAVHAHGDNRELLDSVVPRLDTSWVLPTTQAVPSEPIVNTGGFTDGDRAAFLADALGAGELRFAGWDLADRSVDELKRRKLVWAGRLCRLLEKRRGERYVFLDGHRETLDSAVP